MYFSKDLLKDFVPELGDYQDVRVRLDTRWEKPLGRDMVDVLALSVRLPLRPITWEALESL